MGAAAVEEEGDRQAACAAAACAAAACAAAACAAACGGKAMLAYGETRLDHFAFFCFVGAEPAGTVPLVLRRGPVGAAKKVGVFHLP